MASNYEQLVKDLRDIEKTMFALGTTQISMDNVSISLAYDKGWGQTANDAADAIEALENVLADECAECDYLVDENARLTTENRELQAQLPKRGEIVRCGECKHWMDIDNGRQKHEMCAQLMPNWFCADGERKVQE